MGREAFRIAKSCGGKGWDPKTCFREMAQADIRTMELCFSGREMCDGLNWQHHATLAKTYGIELWSSWWNGA